MEVSKAQWYPGVTPETMKDKNGQSKQGVFRPVFT
jgi:hypothetical protein